MWDGQRQRRARWCTRPPICTTAPSGRRRIAGRRRGRPSRCRRDTSRSASSTAAASPSSPRRLQLPCQVPAVAQGTGRRAAGDGGGEDVGPGPSERCGQQRPHRRGLARSLAQQRAPGDGEPVGVEAGRQGTARDQRGDQLGLAGGEVDGGAVDIDGPCSIARLAGRDPRNSPYPDAQLAGQRRATRAVMRRGGAGGGRPPSRSRPARRAAPRRAGSGRRVRASPRVRRRAVRTAAPAA